MEDVSPTCESMLLQCQHSDVEASGCLLVWAHEVLELFQCEEQSHTNQILYIKFRLRGKIMGPKNKLLTNKD